MKKRNKRSRSAPKCNTAWIKPVLGIVFVTFIAFVAYHQGARFFKTSSFFNVKDIAYDDSVKNLQSKALDRLKGKNLFAINLKKIQKDLQYQYPEISDLKISRRFPDQIYVSAQRRIAVARIKVKGKTVLLDKYGVILPASAGEGLELPYLNGVDAAGWKTILGTRMTGKDLGIALKIVNSFQSEPALSTYQISRLDVSNFSEIFFFLSNNLKVVIDRDNIPNKIRMLSAVLTQVQPDFEDIKYIDLRFKEPILGKNL